METKWHFNKKIFLQDVTVWSPAIILFFIYHEVMIHLFNASCPLILLLGIPCPGCGMTRAIAMVLSFQFEKAIYLNPVSFLWVAFIVYFIVSRYFLTYNKRLIYIFLSIVLVLTFARYIYGMLMYYPHRVPYVYTRRNLTYYLLHRS